MVANLRITHILFFVFFTIGDSKKDKRFVLDTLTDQGHSTVEPSHSQSNVKNVTLAQLQSEIQNLKAELDVLRFQQSSAVGTMLTRWGRSDCPNDTDLTYSGYTGGSYDSSGGPGEYVCLPPDPQYGPFQDLWLYGAAMLYGAQYQDEGLFGYDRTYEVPCAVCRSSLHSTTLMIPGRNECYDGWTEAYHGILSAANRNSRSDSEYVCVDELPEGLPEDTNSTHYSSYPGGKAFCQVRSQCGLLPCPPYLHDKLMTCVVCLK